MDESIVTGTDVLRQTVKARNRSPHAISLIAREVEGIGASTLEHFAAGEADLNADTLQALTKVLYPHSEFDPELNLLRSANRAPPTPLGIRPPPLDPTKLPKFKAGPPPMGPQPVKPEKPTVKTGRPGWLDSWT